MQGTAVFEHGSERDRDDRVKATFVLQEVLQAFLLGFDNYLAWAANDENIVKLLEMGAGPKLVKLMDEGTPDAKTYAAGALWNLAANHADNKAAIAEAGGIPPLVALLQDWAREQEKDVQKHMRTA